MTDTAYIGIDPGLTGAVAVLRPGRTIVHDMPVVAIRPKGIVRNEVHALSLARLFDEIEEIPYAIIERTSAMPKQGVASMFSMGVSRGIVLGVLGALCVDYMEVAPHVWKKRFALTGGKDASLRLAQRLFPEARHLLARQKDHNRAEALLLARYLQSLVGP